MTFIKPFLPVFFLFFFFYNKKIKFILSLFYAYVGLPVDTLGAVEWIFPRDGGRDVGDVWHLHVPWGAGHCGHRCDPSTSCFIPKVYIYFNEKGDNVLGILQ